MDKKAQVTVDQLSVNILASSKNKYGQEFAEKISEIISEERKKNRLTGGGGWLSMRVTVSLSGEKATFSAFGHIIKQIVPKKTVDTNESIYIHKGDMYTDLSILAAAISDEMSREIEKSAVEKLRKMFLS